MCRPWSVGCGRLSGYSNLKGGFLCCVPQTVSVHSMPGTTSLDLEETLSGRRRADGLDAFVADVIMSWHGGRVSSPVRQEGWGCQIS